MPIYTIRHSTLYKYAEPVKLSLSQMRLQPRELPGQRLMAYEVETSPQVVFLEEGPDYFGNPTAIFRLGDAHETFEITSRARVDVSWAARETPPPTLPWETAVEAISRADTPELQDALQFALESPLVKVFPDLRDYASLSFPPGRPLGMAVYDLMRRIHRNFRFLPGSTSLTTTLEMVFQTRCGVCQDFTHIMLGCLRAMNLAGRYVSGYLETDAPVGQEKLLGADATHAWVSAFIPGSGWLDYDPTNCILPGPRHITVAWGRDFSDVSPLRGVLYGGGEQEMTVEVDVLREG